MPGWVSEGLPPPGYGGASLTDLTALPLDAQEPFSRTVDKMRKILARDLSKPLIVALIAVIGDQRHTWPAPDQRDGRGPLDNVGLTRAKPFDRQQCLMHRYGNEFA